MADSTASYLPAALDVAAYRGDSLTIPLAFKTNADPPVAINVTTWTLTAQVRKSSDSLTALASFTIDAGGAATGLINLVLSAATMATLPIGKPLTWDLQRVLSGLTRTLVAGTLTISGDATRP